MKAQAIKDQAYSSKDFAMFPQNSLEEDPRPGSNDRQKSSLPYSNRLDNRRSLASSHNAIFHPQSLIIISSFDCVNWPRIQVTYANIQ